MKKMYGRITLGFAVMFVLILVLAACSARVNLTGTWTGTDTFSGGAGLEAVELDMIDDGGSLSGTISYDGALYGSVAGTATGNSFTFTATNTGATQQIRYNGTVSGATMSGSWEIISGTDAGLTGTFEYTRQ